MFKRQFYALEHSNGGDSASSSSSSSLATASDGEGGADVQDDAAWPASSHESDSSSQEEVVEAQGATSVEGSPVLSHEDSEDCADGSDGEEGDVSDIEPEERKRKLQNQWAEAVEDDETERVLDKFKDSSVICVGTSKPVFKCRLCPKVLCLSEESMEGHLSSKGHARSLKQLADGKLRVQLGSDGEEEEDGETHAERHARTVLTAQELKTPKRKRDSGRQRQRKRLKKKALLTVTKEKTGKDVSGSLLTAIEVKNKTQVSMTSNRKDAEGKVLGKQKTIASASSVQNGSSSQKQPSKSERRDSISQVLPNIKTPDS